MSYGSVVFSGASSGCHGWAWWLRPPEPWCAVYARYVQPRRPCLQPVGVGSPAEVGVCRPGICSRCTRLGGDGCGPGPLLPRRQRHLALRWLHQSCPPSSLPVVRGGVGRCPGRRAARTTVEFRVAPRARQSRELPWSPASTQLVIKERSSCPRSSCMRGFSTRRCRSGSSCRRPAESHWSFWRRTSGGCTGSSGMSGFCCPARSCEGPVDSGTGQVMTVFPILFSRKVFR